MTPVIQTRVKATKRSPASVFGSDRRASEPAAVPAFPERAGKMSRQNDFLRHQFNFIPSPGDHYANLKQLRRSIDAQRQTGKRRADMHVYAEPPGPTDDTK
jgi:hypothetical protein